MPSLRFDRQQNDNVFALQPLEVRRLLTTAFVDASNTLQVGGTSSGESITINRNTSGRLTVTGVASTFAIGNSAGQVNKIVVGAAGGSDIIVVTNNVRFPSGNAPIPTTLRGEGGNDTITGGPANDQIFGGTGNDVIDGGAGNDLIDGADGFDTANYSSRTSPLLITMGSGANDGQVNIAEADNVLTEECLGGSANDTITGSAAGDYIGGGAGNDSMSGGSGNDHLTGSSGQDKFFGQNGDDFLLAQNNDQDTVNGGTNSDGSPDLDLASIDPIDVSGAALPRTAPDFGGPSVVGSITLGDTTTTSTTTNPATANTTTTLAAAAAGGLPSDLDASYGTDGIAEIPLENAFSPVTGVDPQGRVVFLYTGGEFGDDVVAKRLTAAGQLDSAFGTPLIDTTDPLSQGGNVEDLPTAVAFGADGAVFVLIARFDVETDRGFAVAKLTSAGELDETFGGGDGIAVFDFGSLTAAANSMRAIDLQRDGKIVIAGSVNESLESFESDFLVARLNGDGSLDQTFNGSGYNAVNLPTGDNFDSEWANDIAFQSLSSDAGAQRIILAGASNDGTAQRGAILRFAPDGTLDSSFGSGGAVLQAFGDITEFRRLAVSPSNAIFVAGTQVTFVIVSAPSAGGVGAFDFVARFGTNGADPGQAVFDDARINDLTADAQSRVIAVGESNGDFYVIRYNDGLQPDTNFAPNGFVTIDANGFEAFDSASSIRILPSGALVIGGEGIEFNESTVGLGVRLGGDGGGGGIDFDPVPEQHGEGEITEVEGVVDYDDIHDPNFPLFANVSATAKFYSLSQLDDQDIARIVLEGDLDYDNVITVYNVIAGDGRQNVAVSVDGVVLYYDAKQTARIEIYAGDGNDTVTVERKVNVPLIIDGGAGNDSIFGGAAADVVLGGEGDDSIEGGQGLDILIGGAGADYIKGEPKEDLIIAGTTAHDADADALAALSKEWSRRALISSRIANLRDGGGLNGTFVLRGSSFGVDATVFDDDAIDTINGDGAIDWLFVRTSGDNADILLGGVGGKIVEEL